MIYLWIVLAVVVVAVLATAAFVAPRLTGRSRRPGVRPGVDSTPAIGISSARHSSATSG